MTRLALPLYILPLLAMLASCSDSSDDPAVAVYQNIVTFMGNGPTAAYFGYREYGDSPEVTLGVPGTLDTKKVAVGTRLLMTYSLPSDVKYGDNCSDVTLHSLQQIYTDTVTTVSHQQAMEANAPIYLSTLYRSGPYINIYASMPILPSRRYFIVADESTIQSDTIRLYLSTSVPEQKPTYNSTQVASIYLGPLWTESTGKTFSLAVNNTNNVYRRLFCFSN